MREFITTIAIILLISAKLLGQENQTITIYLPSSSELEQLIFKRLQENRVQIERKEEWNEVEMRELASLSNAIFPTEYIERKLTKQNYKVIWKDLHENHLSQPHNSLFGELTKDVKIHKGGGKSIFSVLKMYDQHGTLKFEGEPQQVIKQLKKGGA